MELVEQITPGTWLLLGFAGMVLALLLGILLAMVFERRNEDHNYKTWAERGRADITWPPPYEMDVTVLSEGGAIKVSMALKKLSGAGHWDTNPLPWSITVGMDTPDPRVIEGTWSYDFRGEGQKRTTIGGTGYIPVNWTAHDKPLLVLVTAELGVLGKKSMLVEARHHQAVNVREMLHVD